MTWFNLYSTELKYKLTVYPSKIERIWLLLQLTSVLGLLSLIFAHFFSIIYALIICLLFSALFYYFYPSKLKYIGFTIDLSGKCQYGINEIWQITPQSRISYWGSYLFLEKVDPSTNDSYTNSIRKTRFYFKDSFSKQDYARLSRVIIKMQKQTVV